MNVYEARFVVFCGFGVIAGCALIALFSTPLAFVPAIVVILMISRIMHTHKPKDDIRFKSNKEVKL